jgi:hypothetical protein
MCFKPIHNVKEYAKIDIKIHINSTTTKTKK